MSRIAPDDDFEDEDFEEDFGENDFDEEGDEDDTIPCPYCQRQVHEESQRCPHCENWISDEDAPAVRQPWWIGVGVVLCLLVIYFWIMG